MPNARNKDTDPVQPEGIIQAFCQLNTNTRKIKENQRFLFGGGANWVCYKVLGGGLRNYFNQTTTDNTSAAILTLSLEKTSENTETDDLQNGIVDRYRFTSGSATVNAVRILPTSGSVIEGETTIFDVRLMSGSTITSGSFIFTASGSVPASSYVLTTLSGNTFSVENLEKYLDSSLQVVCASGSTTRTKDILLKGVF